MPMPCLLFHKTKLGIDLLCLLTTSICFFQGNAKDVSAAIEGKNPCNEPTVVGHPSASEDIDDWAKGLEARVKNRDLVLEHIELRLGVLEEKLGLNK